MSANFPVVNQGVLWKQLRIIFPNTEIHLNTREKSTIKKPSTNEYFELDVWIPSLSLCFEFQDSYHYVPTWYYQQSLVDIQQDDIVKQMAVQQNQMSLVKVPCWWDGELPSLKGTIQFQRPDVFAVNENEPIPLNPILGFFASTDLPEVGELMLASFPNENTTASLLSDKWWMGEKYDGIRCCWNGHRRILYSRKGREISLGLISFLKHFPLKEYLDGELWFGRGQFSNTYALIQGEANAVPWHSLKMISFDVPSILFHEKPFEERYLHLLSLLPREHPFIVAAARSLRQSSQHQHEVTKSIIEDEGEGVIMRRCGSLYHPGRSPYLLKLKSTQGDQEGMVVHVDDKFVRLKLASGRFVSVPKQDVLVPALKQGDIVTFSYESHARRALPVNPQIVRLRTDLLWADVLTNASKDKRYLSERHSSAIGFTAQPLRHWTAKNMRLFLETYAKNRKMDPLDPNTWYRISSNDIRQTRGGGVVLDKFKGGYFRMLQKLFPEIGLDESAFNIRARWHDIRARRNFFEKYAKENNFDPLKAENWRAQSREKIMAFKGARSVVFHHNNKLSTALSDLFGFEKLVIPSNKPIWNDSDFRRHVFERYAQENSFDPLVPHNWYSQRIAKLLAFEGVRFAILFHKYSVSKALLELFPEIGLEKEKLHGFKPEWDKQENRRKFFETYARLNNFDPLNPDAWYSQSSDKILSQKGARRAIFYHNNSLAQALLDLFPEIGLSKRKLPSFRPEWTLASNRRKFFQNYAEDRGFDYRVPENWYSLPRDSLLLEKGGPRILSFHGNSMRTALVELFPDITFDLSRFDDPHAKLVLHDSVSRRQIFEKYARENKFDPLNPESWYLHAKSRKILSFKGILGAIGHHKLSVPKALLDLFPDIGLEKSKL